MAHSPVSGTLLDQVAGAGTTSTKGAGTSASAGIPGYVEAYLYAEQATLRHEAIRTEEVANGVAFLLSPRSSGINAQHLVVDAGMSVNYFDRDLIERALR